MSTHRTEIIPAILPRVWSEIEDSVVYVQGFAKTVQIDICDGQFTPEATWPYRKHDDTFERIIREEEGMPGWQELDYEFDLMVNRPEEVVDEWVQAGAKRIIIHIEAKGDIMKAIDTIAGRTEVGLALDMATDIHAIAPYLEKIQFVQLMGIDNVGFQHQPFDEKAIGRVKEARMAYPGLPISVDGGVSLENAPLLIAAGADRLVVGSAIFSSGNPLDALHKLMHL